MCLKTGLGRPSWWLSNKSAINGSVLVLVGFPADLFSTSEGGTQECYNWQ